MKKAWLFLFVVAVALPVLAGTIYRWVDSEGVVHYSDQPHKGAKQVNLNAPQVIDFKLPAPERAEDRPPKEQAVPNYSVAILAPADGTTLRPIENQVHVRVKVTPALGPTALLQYAFDGKPLAEPTTALRALIKQVYRGTHTLTVSVLSGKGDNLESASSTFYVHQHSILNNPNSGPGPNPGPGG